MKDKFRELKNNIPSHETAKDLVCFIVFGSNVVNNNTGANPIDVDICVVVKDRNANLEKISEYIFTHFEKPDFRIYIKDEIDSAMNFVDVGNGSFAMEYYANGLFLFGENIFSDMLKKANREKIRQDYLNKIFEYILRIRVAYVSKKSSPEYKLWHLNKYVLRMSIDILLYYGYIEYHDLKSLNKNDIFNLCKKHGIVELNREINYECAENLYDLFKEINLNFVKLHTKKEKK